MTVYCMYCGRPFEDPGLANKHHWEHERYCWYPKLYCPICGKKIDSDQFQAHIDKHGGVATVMGQKRLDSFRGRRR